MLVWFVALAGTAGHLNEPNSDSVEVEKKRRERHDVIFYATCNVDRLLRGSFVTLVVPGVGNLGHHLINFWIGKNAIWKPRGKVERRCYRLGDILRRTSRSSGRSTCVATCADSGGLGFRNRGVGGYAICFHTRGFLSAGSSHLEATRQRSDTSAKPERVLSIEGSIDRGNGKIKRHRQHLSSS